MKKVTKGCVEIKNAIEVNQEQIKGQLSELVRQSVEETLNGLLAAEADQLCQAKRYERVAGRADTRAGHYKRSLQTQAGKVTLKMPKLRTLPFETRIIERYRRRESSVEEALLAMYYAGVSMRRVEDITDALWGARVRPSTLSDLNQKVAVKIDEWRTRPLTGRYVYVWLDAIWLKRTWAGEVCNVSVLVAIGVGEEGFREILGVQEGMKEDKESWSSFLKSLRRRGLKGTELFITDKCLGLVESLGEIFPEARWQRCVVHWYRNVLRVVPQTKWPEVAAMLKAIHAQENRSAARRKAQDVYTKLLAMKLTKASQIVREGVEETLAYMSFPREHWLKIRTTNPLERINREIRRRTRVVGAFPDGNAAVLLVAARLRHIAGSHWGTRIYMNMKHLENWKEPAI
ncbi:MAG: IS256 family transposase [Kiritimatiellia bacterium]|jgi:transposase-like protein|nr:IS256 family transposase [Kiritimatiellia bacterium]HOR74906.1 IS256 family transposase [Kiritimatiellia bacterium]